MTGCAVAAVTPGLKFYLAFAIRQRASSSPVADQFPLSQAGQHLTRHAPRIIFPLFWKYEDIQRRHLTFRIGARHAARHLSAARAARPGRPSGRRDCSPPPTAGSNPLLPSQCFGCSRAHTAAQKRAFDFVLRNAGKCEPAHEFSNGELLRGTGRLRPSEVNYASTLQYLVSLHR